MQITVFDNQQLKEIIKETVKQTVKELLQNQAVYITKKQAMLMLNVNYYTLNKLIKSGQIKATPDNKKVVLQSVYEYINHKNKSK